MAWKSLSVMSLGLIHALIGVNCFDIQSSGQDIGDLVFERSVRSSIHRVNI